MHANVCGSVYMDLDLFTHCLGETWLIRVIQSSLELQQGFILWIREASQSRMDE